MAISPPVDRPAKPAALLAPVPPLQHGDRLARAEFERRFDAMPELKKAELIEGIAYMGPPVRHEPHSHPHTCLVGWPWVYAAGAPGVQSGDSGGIRLDLARMPQPDAYLIVRPRYGGQARISEDDSIEGAPELVAEVAASSASIDPGDKQDAYLLWFDPAAMARGDSATALTVLRQGIGSPEHAAGHYIVLTGWNGVWDGTESPTVNYDDGSGG
jgi:Uma2 family endonuclease